MDSTRCIYESKILTYSYLTNKSVLQGAEKSRLLALLKLPFKLWRPYLERLILQYMQVAKLQ